MTMALFESNIVQLGMTAGFGGVLFLLAQRVSWLVAAIGYILSAGIIFSALFNVGEVYIYSDYYRRAFFYYTDGVTTLIVFVFLWAIITQNRLLAGMAAAAIFLSGGKISLGLLAITIGLLLYLHKNEWRFLAKNIGKFLAIGVMGYALVNSTALVIEKYDILQYSWLEKSEVSWLGESRDRRSSCRTVEKCLQTQFGKAWNQRYYSSLAGLWMTMQGGFLGERYPNSKEKFADLIMVANPFGMNDYYGLSHENWTEMGGVQNPWLAFGAGYGPWLLALLLAIFFAICWLGATNIRARQRDETALYPIYFIVITIFSQTQSWLMSGSPILILVGFLSTQIIASALIRKDMLPNAMSIFLFPRLCRLNGTIPNRPA